VTVHGRNKLNFYTKDCVLQFKGDRSFNALKYVNFWHHYKNKTAGKETGSHEFLGL